LVDIRDTTSISVGHLNTMIIPIIIQRVKERG
jgi:hypothetical protein